MDSSKAKRLKTTERREQTEEKCITEPPSQFELKKIIVQDFTRKGTTEKKVTLL